MNKCRYILVALLMLAGIRTEVFAQPFEKMWRRNFWNDSYNVAGLRLDSLSFSYAEIYGGIEDGGFRESWQPRSGWNAGVVTSSIRHLGRMSLTGSFGFSQTEGYEMCGSMFIRPGYYPVDVLEFTPGRKTLQTYVLDGGFAYEVKDGWSIGAGLDFEASNMAKRKDLRHTNWRLDMLFSPGFMYENGKFAVGASALLRKTSETVDAEQIGTPESSYYAFLDKGMMYGVYSVWTGSGVHLDEAGVTGLPVMEISYGGSSQVQYSGLYASVSVLATAGKVGEKDYIWFRFPGKEVRADLGYKWQGNVSEQSLRLGLFWKTQTMEESVLENVNINGVTNVLRYGSNIILTKDSYHLTPEYEYIGKNLELRAGAELNLRRSISSQIYPYIYTQSVAEMAVFARPLVHIGAFDLAMTLKYAEGQMWENDRMAAEDSGVQTVPFRLEKWHELAMEYDMAARIGAGLSVRYNFLKGLYIEGAGDWLHGFDLKYISGADRVSATLKFGYTF